MCKTRLSVKTGQNVTKCTGYSTVVTIRVFDDDAIFHRKRVEDGVLSWNAKTRTTSTSLFDFSGNAKLNEV